MEVLFQLQLLVKGTEILVLTKVLLIDLLFEILTRYTGIKLNMYLKSLLLMCEIYSILN